MTVGGGDTADSEEHDKVRPAHTEHSSSPTIDEAVDASQSYHSDRIWQLSWVTWKCYELLVKHLERSIQEDTSDQKLHAGVGRMWREGGAQPIAHCDQN